MLIEAPARTTPERRARVVVEVLEGARNLIANPDHWVQGAYATDQHGNSVLSHGAVRFCAVGALKRAAANVWAPTGVTWEARLMLDRVAADGPEFVNDYQGHEAVLAMYDRAIAFAREVASC
jgi:hypothetical protein